MREPPHSWLLAAYLPPGRVFVAHTNVLQLLGFTCCTESHKNWLQLLGLTCCTEDRLWRTTTTLPPMNAPLHSWLLAAYLSPGRVFVAHTHWLQLLGLTRCTESHTHWLQLLGLCCCTEDRLWRTTTTPPPIRATVHSWLLAAYLSPGRVFVAHTHWLQLLGLTCSKYKCCATAGPQCVVEPKMLPPCKHCAKRSPVQTNGFKQPPACSSRPPELCEYGCLPVFD